MLNSRPLARLLCKQLRCGRVSPSSRMLGPLNPCLLPKFPVAVGSSRTFVDAGAVNSLASVVANIDGTISLLTRLFDLHPNPDFEMPLKQLGQARQWLKALQKNNPEMQELVEVMLNKSDEMHTAVRKMQSSKFNARSSTYHIARQMQEMFANSAILTIVSNSKTAHFRMMGNVPIIYEWSTSGIDEQLQTLAPELCKVPKPDRPVLQPMSGDVDVAKLEYTDAFYCVLEPAEADAKWQDVPKPDDPNIQGIQKSKEQACKHQEPAELAADQPDEGVVRRILQVDRAKILASTEGIVFVSNGHELFWHGVEGGGTVDVKDMHFAVPFSDFDIAIAGDLVALSRHDYYYDREEREVRDVVRWGRISEDRTKVKELSGVQIDHERLVPGGLSLTDSNIYFCHCFKHAVQCVDIETRKIHNVIGMPGTAGCGCEGTPPTELLLDSPSDTAVVGSFLFVADSLNSRVLCLDLRKNKCQVVFKGRLPWRLAADSGGCFVYDLSQNKIFHVTMRTWEVRHVLGTGIRGYSPEGLPPLSTNLGEVRGMTIGHNGELAFLCADDHVIRGFCMPPLPTPDLWPEGTSCATHMPLLCDGRDDEQDAQLPSADLQPTFGARWLSFSTQPSPMCISDALAKDKNSFIFKTKMKSPTHGLGICLVAETSGPSDKKPVDCHILSPPEWDAKTHVATLSKMRAKEQLDSQPFKKLWKKAIDTFRNLVSSRGTAEETSATKPFYLRDENLFEILVERTYDADADCSTWKVVKVKINGKDRAGSLDSLTVGVDVAVRICMFVATEGGCLEFVEEPKLIY